MRRFSLNGAVFLFMARREKLSSKDIWNGTGELYVLWPRGEFWDVRFRHVMHGKLEWKSIADKPFSSEDEAWQAAYANWENRPEFNNYKYIK